MNEFNWDNAVKEWQHLQPDVPALKKSMRWVTWRMRCIVALDVLVLLLFIPFWIYIFDKPQSSSVKVWFGTMFLLAVIGVYFDIYLRKGLWQDDLSSTRAMLEFVYRRTLGGVRLARFSIIYMALFFVSISGWVGYTYFFEPEQLQKDFALIGILLGYCMIAAVVIGAVWYRKRKQREVENIKQMLDQYINSEKSEK